MVRFAWGYPGRSLGRITSIKTHFAASPLSSSLDACLLNGRRWLTMGGPPGRAVSPLSGRRVGGWNGGGGPTSSLLGLWGRGHPVGASTRPGFRQIGFRLERRDAE